MTANVWAYYREYGECHTQKPLALLERILRASSNENDIAKVGDKGIDGRIFPVGSEPAPLKEHELSLQDRVSGAGEAKG
jgi:hypothetical protein